MRPVPDAGASAGRLACVLNSGCDCIQVLASAVEVVSRRAGLNDRDVNRVVLAVDELFANIGRHGYGGREGRIELWAEQDGPELRFTLRDYAPPLAGLAMDSGDAPFDGSKPGGLGLRLIRAIMDEVRHERLADGNRWVLVKRIRAQAQTHETSMSNK